MEVDEQGYIICSVYTDRDADGNIIQQSIMVGDYSLNLTTGENGSLGGECYCFSLSALVQDFNSALETFGASLQNPGETVSFSGSVRQMWVEKDTGKPLQRAPHRGWQMARSR